MKQQSISIVIPNYNGKMLLEQILPFLIKATEYYQGDSEIIVVDDGSVDGSESFLKDNFHQVDLIKNSKNQGFSRACNRGFRVCKNNLVILLNNDVFVESNFIEPMTLHFQDRDVFAVRPGLKNEFGMKKESLYNPKIGGAFKYGRFDVPKEVDKVSNYAFFAGGGAAIYDREKFLHLGGFDEIFSPFYFEDVDLSYRAWKRGWKIIYEPKSLVYHQSGMTINRFYSSWKIDLVRERNSYFLIWKNIADPQYIFQHLLFFPLRLIFNLLKFNLIPFLTFLWAIMYLGPIFKKRQKEERFRKVRDKDIFAVFNKKL